MINRFLICFFTIIFVVAVSPHKVIAKTTDLPECVVITHCVRKDFKADDLENAFKKATKIVENTARTKIVEKTDSYIHAEAKLNGEDTQMIYLLRQFQKKVFFKSDQNQELELEIMELTKRGLMILQIV
tara:strand:+ start:455 stop:841 length:387 start_codon:yes stop_codon:yes gene_type:complete